MYRKGATIPFRNYMSRSVSSEDSILRPVLSESTYVKGESENIRIDKDGHSYLFNMDSFRRKLRRLHEKGKLHVSKLEKERHDLDEIIQVMNRLHPDKENYSKLMKEIRDTFSDIKNPEPETVAARFIGCYRHDDGLKLDNKGCDPSCAASLAPTEEIKNYSRCEDMVLDFKDNVFASLNGSTAERAFISVKKTDVFSEENVKNLKDAGITSVILVISNGDGVPREIKGPIPIDNLQYAQSSSSSDSSSTNGWAITFIVVLILLILAILALIYYSVFSSN